MDRYWNLMFHYHRNNNFQGASYFLSDILCCCYFTASRFSICGLCHSVHRVPGLHYQILLYFKIAYSTTFVNKDCRIVRIQTNNTIIYPFSCHHMTPLASPNKAQLLENIYSNLFSTMKSFLIG